MRRRKDRKTKICFQIHFSLLSFICTLLFLFSFVYSLQDIDLFVGAPFVVGPQGDYCCQIYRHCVLFLIYPNEVPL